MTSPRSLDVAFSQLDLSLVIESPDVVWIYVLADGDRVVYVGRTTNLMRRITAHRFGSRLEPAKKFDRAWHLPVCSANAAAYEGALVRRFDPPLVDHAPADESRDIEILARLGLRPDGFARSNFIARRRRLHVEAHRRRLVRALAQRKRRRGGLSATLWRTAKRTLGSGLAS